MDKSFFQLFSIVSFLLDHAEMSKGLFNIPYLMLRTWVSPLVRVYSIVSRTFGKAVLLLNMGNPAGLGSKSKVLSHIFLNFSISGHLNTSLLHL